MSTDRARAPRKTKSPVRTLTGQIEINSILDEVGRDYIPDKFNGRELLRDLDNAKAHFNLRLDFGLNKRQLNDRVLPLSRVEGHARELSKKLREVETARQIRIGWRTSRKSEDSDDSERLPSFEILRDAVEELAFCARCRRFEIQKFARIAPLKGRSHNRELVAYLAVVFEDNFGKQPGYSQEQDESAPINTFARFVLAVSKQFGLPVRSHRSIANDLTKSALRIRALKKAKRSGTKSSSRRAL